MCELLGMSFNLPIKPNISFRGFCQRGEHNPDGWGIAYYPDESVQIFKEPKKTNQSFLSRFLKNYDLLISKIIISHVRLTSGTIITHKNTHPFHRELNGKDYVFAHNGTLHSYRSLKLEYYKPVGDTDSEYAFCHLLHSIKAEQIDGWDNKNFEWLTQKFQEINSKGSFNCIFSDGKYLFCYHDKHGYRGLNFLQRKPPYSKIKLLDEDWEVNLSAEKDPEQRGFIVATKPLTDENWKNFESGELIVFKDGEIIYSNKRNISEKINERPFDLFTDTEILILKILRRSPNRLSIREITIKSNYSIDEIKNAINSLYHNRYVFQDTRDKVNINHEEATFYTNPKRRRDIDITINAF
ncbi:MAG: class II glutamine amidotransferase [Desulfobacterales bacterium]|nr:class II glutamine amidotransferase [Desulfobacterales bacterium]